MTRLNRSTLSAWRERVALPAALVGITVVFGAGGALAAAPTPPFGITNSTFEILDGNTVPAQAAADSLDWDTPGLDAKVQPDRLTGSGDDSFGNGTKEDTAVPTVSTGSIPPNKSDLKEFGSSVERNANGQFLHLFWTRVQDPSGTTNMDFEFNQNICTPNAATPNITGCSANGVTPTRLAGDLLITYDLSRGGTRASISLREWTGSAWGAAGALDPNVATGSINTETITSSLTGSTYSPRTFGEASINLALIFNENECRAFGGAYLKSRASDSFTSALKDFIAPIGVDLTNCGRLVVHKNDQDGNKLGGAGFTVTPGRNGAASSAMTQSAPGVFCLDNLRFGTAYSVQETTVPDGFTGDTVARSFTPNSTANSGTCASVSGATTPDQTFVNRRNTGSILIHKVDEAGAPLDEAAFSATLRPGETALNVPQIAAGVFCLDGLPTGGTYGIAETLVPAGYNPPAGIDDVTVSTASTCGARGVIVGPDRTVTNSPAPGRIDIVKTDDSSPPLALDGAVFTLFVDADGNGVHDANEVATVGSAQTTANSGTASFTDVPLGKYCVVETTTPAGYATAPAQCVTIGLGATARNGQTLELTFVDPRLHKVIVLVCHEGTNTLVASDVVSDGQTKRSLAAPPADLTDAALCGLGGAVYPGLGHSPALGLSVTPGH